MIECYEIQKVPGKGIRPNWDDPENFMKEVAFAISLEEWKDFSGLREEASERNKVNVGTEAGDSTCWLWGAENNRVSLKTVTVMNV